MQVQYFCHDHTHILQLQSPVFGNKHMESRSANVNVNQTLTPIVGYWVGIINLTKIKENLSGLKFTKSRQ